MPKAQLHPVRSKRADELMTRAPLTLPPEASLDRAWALIERHGFRHLPVTEGDDLLGILSDRDLDLATGHLPGDQRDHDAEGRSVATPIAVEQLMRTPVRTIAPEVAAEEAAAILLEERIGAVPVLRDGHLIGILTESDLIAELASGCSDGRLGCVCERPVFDFMQRSPTTIGPEATLDEALERCRQARVRHLPLVQEGRVRGIVSDRDLRRALGLWCVRDSIAQSEGRMNAEPPALTEVASRYVVQVEPELACWRAAQLMLAHGIGALPVVDEDWLDGILTRTDLLRAYVNPAGR